WSVVTTSGEAFSESPSPSFSGTRLSYLSFSPITTIIRAFQSLSGVDHFAHNTAEITDNRNAAFIFHTDRSDDSKKTGRTVIGRVRGSDKRKVPHIGNTEFRAYADLHAFRGPVRNALIQDPYQTSFLFEHLEEHSHALDIGKFRLIENVCGSLQIKAVGSGLFLKGVAPCSQQREHAVEERSFELHQTQKLISNLRQRFSGEFFDEISAGLVQFFLRVTLGDANELALQ